MGFRRLPSDIRRKLNDSLRRSQGGLAFHDVSDNIGGTQSHGLSEDRDTASGFVIHFVHVPTGETCHFKAFLTSFEDTYESQWNEEEVFGRMDPISTFQRTRRRIRLGWDVPAASEREAILNLRESEKLLSMLYPVYEEQAASSFVNGDENAAITNPNASRTVSTMAAPPLFKIKFSNLIMDSKTGMVNSGASQSGLVGTIAGLSYRPDIEQGFFGGFNGDGEAAEFREIEEGALVPQTLSFDIDFVVHHTHSLGFRKRKRNQTSEPGNQGTSRPQRDPGFPYRSDKILR